MQTEYETYGDYDAFTDYSAGPTYTREDLKPGTVFDAEDEETDFTPPSGGLMSQDQGAQGSDAGFEDNTDYGVDMGGPAYDY